MKYIIMCGGQYTHWIKPKQLLEINGEPIVARTIRLLRESGITDISISSHNPEFEKFGVPVLHHENNYKASEKGYNGNWVDAFYPTSEPTCYIFGDVVFSPEAIQTIVETKTYDIEFFASAPPFSTQYFKKWAEPFALKVVNTEHLRQAVTFVQDNQDLFKRRPIMWELWQVIRNTPLNKIDYTNYTVINDYTCDVDYESEIKNFEALIKESTSKSHETQYMIHTMPKRRWYVDEYLIPSMLKQGIKESQITVYSDDTKQGNLKACMNSWLTLDDSVEGTWHLQDDIIISSNFKEQTEKHDKGIVCAFKSYYDKDLQPGLVPVQKMWYSFPCIRIPNEIAKKCAAYTLEYMIGNPVYRNWWKDGKSDDVFFRQYVWDWYKKEMALNLAPNIVDHVDYLIGGTVASVDRKVIMCRSQYWDEEDLVKKLDKQLQKDGRRHKWADYNRQVLK